MVDRINGRTLDAIKLGLKHGVSDCYEVKCCELDCPYDDVCEPGAHVEIPVAIVRDALELIQQLESIITEAYANTDSLNELLTVMSNRYKAMKRERDAAVEELSMLARGTGDECYSCRFAEFTPDGHECKRAEIIAEETGEEVEGGTLICRWDWKGLQELHEPD